MRGPPAPTRPRPFLERTVAFLARELPPAPASVLEIGCGQGEVAERLARRGYDVTAIDLDRAAVAATRRRGVRAVRADVRSFRGGPFDAIVCVFSLHHVAPLSSAGAKVRALLRPNGRLLVRDFAWEEADAPTAAFWLDTMRTLVAAGPAHPYRPLPAVDAEPLDAWRDRNQRPERLHPGRAMLRMLQIRFHVQRIERGPFLYAVLGGAVRGPRRSPLTETLFEIERRRIASGAIRPIGLDVVARRPAWDAR